MQFRTAPKWNHTDAKPEQWPVPSESRSASTTPIRVELNLQGFHSPTYEALLNVHGDEKHGVQLETAHSTGRVGQRVLIIARQASKGLENHGKEFYKATTYCPGADPNKHQKQAGYSQVLPWVRPQLS